MNLRVPPTFQSANSPAGRPALPHQVGPRPLGGSNRNRRLAMNRTPHPVPLPPACAKRSAAGRSDGRGWRSRVRENGSCALSSSKRSRWLSRKPVSWRARAILFGCGLRLVCPAPAAADSLQSMESGQPAAAGADSVSMYRIYPLRNGVCLPGLARLVSRCLAPRHVCAKRSTARRGRSSRDMSHRKGQKESAPLAACTRAATESRAIQAPGR